ncbi:hypothetical protein COCSADRAFT_38114 [Bipolaris sorokiniana ND90Pr]|uniref:Uncharacterized protein n=1 Tax=Cochliobolus sativus (strain ND90Pr / ATCC 201652) TaxID=665912 RepID=M2SLS7_COCSN|nr:uncharacterized protein COCSADRAFT_38114 [Bipolaris sorokiniana ND90Pr]EMD63250.1 hypothetical protein COCSADRAFT_38114 [Bipolaris sorokiniana ND90Pr]
MTDHVHACSLAYSTTLFLRLPRRASEPPTHTLLSSSCPLPTPHPSIQPHPPLAPSSVTRRALSSVS